MIIAEYSVDHPILRETLNRCPESHIKWEHSYGTRDDELVIIFWLETDDFDAFEAAMADDPTVKNPTLQSEFYDRRDYQVELAGRGRKASILPVLISVGGIHLHVTADSEGWRARTRFPDREAFETVYRFYEEEGVPFQFHNIYDQVDPPGGGAPQLTEIQRATLVEAVDSGYLSIPRDCSLEELGDRLGISESAASERFRRGVKALVESTIYR